MTTRVYRSANFGASVLSGTVGSMIPIFDACLVNGYGSQTITGITRSGSTATATCTSAHGLLDRERYDISGATQTEYNGEFVVTVLTTTTFSYEVTGTPTTPATGTITGQLLGSGWTKAHSGTNKAAYQQGTGGDNHLIRINNSGPTVDRRAEVVGYETMSDVDTGTGPFPAAGQNSGTLHFAASSTQDSTARDWIMVCDSSTFVFMAAASGAQFETMYFGSLINYKASDPYKTILIAPVAAGDTTSLIYSVNATGIIANTVNGHYMPRTHDGTGTSVAAGKHMDYTKSAGVTSSGTNGLTYPNPADSALYFGPFTVMESSSVRGELKLVFAVYHNNPLTDDDTFYGSGDQSNKTFQYLQLGSTARCIVLVADSTE